MRFRFVVAGAHVVEVELGLLTAREVVWVDGTVVHDATSMRLSNEIPLRIDGKAATVKVGLGWNLLPTVRLTVEGRPIALEPKGKVAPSGSRADAPLAVATPLPLWGIACVAACALIPIVTLGGAIPAGIGAAGAITCIRLAKAPRWSTSRRVAGCVGVALVCWLLLAVLVGAVRR
ncbi:MAG: hypothetical protein KF795_10645 [Labilithrix sp.]|nr:hypothetical protein [Labilithrix sp.]